MTLTSTDPVCRELHDRVTRGEALSPDEQARLDQWYQMLDREEEAMLAGAGRTDTITDLRARLDVALAQLQITTQRVRSLVAENEAIRREIAVLQQRLAQRPTTRSA